MGDKSRTHTHTLCVQHDLVQLCNTTWLCYSRGTSGFQQCCKFIIHLRQRLLALTIPISADVTTALCCALAPLKLNVCLQLSTACLINLSNYLLRQTRRACCLCWAVFLTGEHTVCGWGHGDSHALTRTLSPLTTASGVGRGCGVGVGVWGCGVCGVLSGNLGPRRDFSRTLLSQHSGSNSISQVFARYLQLKSK